MARLDVPTLQCDRCKTTTQNLTEMSKYQKITHYHISGQDDWDLCPSCYARFNQFMEGYV